MNDSTTSATEPLGPWDAPEYMSSEEARIWADERNAARARTALVAGLRALADDIENSDGPLPTHKPQAQWLIFDHEDQRATAADVVRTLGGHWDKGRSHHAGPMLDFTKDYGGGVLAQIVVDRPAVCERVVVGTTEVTREVPDPDALAKVPTTTVTETVEQVEWRCQPLLADDEKPAVA